MNSNQSPSNNDARSGGRTGMGEKHPESGISPSLTSAGLCYLKLLVSNIVAGSIIGQKGKEEYKIPIS